MLIIGSSTCNLLVIFSFEKARANGDRQVASESLRRFFEQRFSESTDS